jgi:putative copper resistance protein D
MSMAALAALTAIAATLSASGHSGDDGLLSPANIANSLHVIGGLLWGGIIIASISVIFPFLLRAKEPLRELAAVVSLRLSTLAGAVLAVVLLPGLYNAWLQIGAWHGLWATLYGRLLVAKIALVGGMIILGAVNRYRYLPAIQRHAGHPEPRILLTLPRYFRASDEATSIPSFRRTLQVEGLLLIAVLTLAAALSQQTPAIHINHEHMADHTHGSSESDKMHRPRNAPHTGDSRLA